ncbi:MAG: hypothetical protein ACYS6K_07650 [Planctomycetota bacterium]|jgi:hypothetical protein
MPEINGLSGWFLFIEILIAIGTLSVAILAIWGDFFRSKLVSPKLSIQPHNLCGTITKFTDGPRVIYYHLKIVNSRPWVSATNCRVLLRAIYRRGPNQKFSQVHMPVPGHFVWAPAGLTPAFITLTNEQVLDFGRLTENSEEFQPVLYSYVNNFPGFVKANEAVRYCLEVTADDYSKKNYQVFEVAWDGKWSDNLDEMNQSLTIREIIETDEN